MEKHFKLLLEKYELDLQKLLKKQSEKVRSTAVSDKLICSVHYDMSIHNYDMIKFTIISATKG